MRRAPTLRRTCGNLALMTRGLDRRSFLRLLAGAPLLAAGDRAWAVNSAPTATPARSALIERLIHDSRALPTVSRRIDFISGKLLGIRYQSNTLIGGPKRPEKFVIRDDVFDCVTF